MSTARRAERIAKVVAISALVLAAALACFVADASSSTQAALAQAHAGALTRSTHERIQALHRASALLQHAWSRPLAWHPGALEAMSWIKAQTAIAAQDAESAEASTQFAERALAASPMQGLAWMRLAAASLRGGAVALCDARSCLINSERVSPMLPASQACDRIELWRLSGETFSAGDARVAGYLAQAPSRAQIEKCLGFMRAEDLYQAMLRART